MPMRHALPTEIRRDTAAAANDNGSHQIRYVGVVSWLTAVGTFLTVVAVIAQPIIDDVIWLYCQFP